MGSWKRMLLLALVGGALGIATASSPVAAQQRPCADDLKKLCPNVQQGSGEALKCLQEHKDQLSEGCKARIAKGRQRMEKGNKTGQLCKSEIEKFCKDVKKGEGRMKSCLDSHQAELSAPCKEAIAKKMSKTPAAKQAN